MKRNGVELAARYSYGACLKAKELEICALLAALLQSKSSKSDKITKQLKARLIYLKPFFYYVKIATKCQIKDPFSWPVIKAYWLGNELLDRFLTPNLPHHNLVILNDAEIFSQHFGWPAILANLNSCKISVGKVKEIKNDKLRVQIALLISNQKKIFKEECDLIMKKGLLKKVREGDLVSFHWGEGREILDRNEVEYLNVVDELLIEKLNQKERL
ncbi:MAG: DUF6390 family protein [Minisyncoccales bacterium]